MINNQDASVFTCMAVVVAALLLLISTTDGKDVYMY